MLNAVTANFLGDNLQCWMQIQSGKGPWSSEVSGIVKIGQTMTMVLGIKDEENKFDMVVSIKIQFKSSQNSIKKQSKSSKIVVKSIENPMKIQSNPLKILSRYTNEKDETKIISFSGEKLRGS